MKNISIEGTINFRNLGMEYIYTPIPLKIEFQSSRDINIIERKKLIIEIENILKSYINLVISNKNEILKAFDSFNDLFIWVFQNTIRDLKLDYLNDVKSISIQVGDDTHTVDGITNTNQIINLN